jgi:hypothetical protein
MDNVLFVVDLHQAGLVALNSMTREMVVIVLVANLILTASSASSLFEVVLMVLLLLVQEAKLVSTIQLFYLQLGTAPTKIVMLPIMHQMMAVIVNVELGILTVITCKLRFTIAMFLASEMFVSAK